MTPQPVQLDGRYTTLVPLAPAHAAALWQALQDPETYPLWDYLADGPFTSESEFRESIARKSQWHERFCFAILDPRTHLAIGLAAYLRIKPEHRVMEVGNILYTPALQRTAAATEAMYLLARHAFEDLNYRRYEWKCNALNLPSRRAAERLGFTFEGIFRQHMILKGRNRDTAWFSMLDVEWPQRKIEFERWLHPSNFDAEGNQLTPLSQ